MHPDLRKIWTVASTEFGSAIRTKSFIIGILLMPVLIGASMVLQIVIARKVDTRPRTIAVIDGSGGALASSIEQAARTFNQKSVDAQGKTVQPRIIVELVETESPGRVEPARELELSDRIRRGELDAFVVIPPGAIEVPGPKASAPPVLEFHSDNPNDDLLLKWLLATASGEVRSRRLRAEGIDQAIADRIDQPLSVENLGLFERDFSAGAGTLAVKPAQKINLVRTMVVPAVLMFAMFFVILTTTPQLLNSVLEEKISKISEVLLGSVTPFELMMGKLLGNTAFGVLLAILYLACGYGAAAYYGYADFVSPSLLAALAVFLLVAILLYGSLVYVRRRRLQRAQGCPDPHDAGHVGIDVSDLRVAGGVKESLEPAGGRAHALSTGHAVLDDDASGLAARSPRVASWFIDRTGDFDGPLLRVGGCQDLSHRALDAGQGPQLPRAGTLGGGKMRDRRHRLGFSRRTVVSAGRSH